MNSDKQEASSGALPLGNAGALETAEEFFKRRTAGADGKLKQHLDMIPEVPPDPGDELPEGWAPQ